MHLDYEVRKAAGGWGITENGALLTFLGDRSDALQIAQLLTLGAKAAGNSATLLVELENGSAEALDPSVLAYTELPLRFQS